MLSVMFNVNKGLRYAYELQQTHGLTFGLLGHAMMFVCVHTTAADGVLSSASYSRFWQGGSDR